MRKINLSIIVSLLFIVIGCGGGSSSSSSSTNTDSDNSGNNGAGVAAKFAVTGQVELISVTSSGKSAKADPENYYLWMQSRGTKEVIFTPLNADGTYSVSIDNETSVSLGNNYFMGIVSVNPLRFLGTVMEVDASDASKGFTGLEFTGDVKDFNISFDLDAGVGSVPASLSGLDISSDIVARLKNGKTVGVETVGKGEDSKSSSLNAKNTIDQDEDGVPDIFDAMNDGQNLDNLSSTNAGESVLGSSVLSQAIMFMNLKLDLTQAGSVSVADQATVVIDVRSKDASLISKIVAKSVHANFEGGVLDRVPGGFTAVDTWAAEGSLWKDDGYKLYKVTDGEGNAAWTVLFRPKADFNAGDLVLLEVTKTDGTTEDVWVSINFKFESTLTDTTTWSLAGSGSRSSPYDILDTGGRVFSYSAPKDEFGVALSGLDYSLEMFWYDSSEQAVGTREVIQLGLDVMTGQIPEATVDAHTGSSKYMQVDITARYAYGDNCALIVYMKRSSW